MKIIRVERLIDVGGFSETKEWETIYDHITKAIKSVEWPPGSGSFTLYPESGKKRGKGNGVKPIKYACMHYLQSLGWTLEQPFDIATVQKPGKIDACYPVADRCFALEWETGNISSSHRAVNKMVLGILKKILVGGVLIVPTREMYKYLTDRVGNFRELEPYFPLWQSIEVDQGLFGIIAIEHDAVSKAVPRIAKGTDGRSLM